MNDHTCRVCLAPIVRKPGPGRWPQFCGDECRAAGGVQARKPERRPGSCADCARPIQSRSKRCTDCHLNVARAARKPKPVKLDRCAFCEQAFPSGTRSNGDRVRCCSKSCARRLEIREGRHVLQDGTQVGRDPEKRRASAGVSTRKRRALRLAVASEPYTIDLIAERDEFTCHLCGVGVDMGLYWPDRYSPSVDHVVPLSRGGDDTLANVKLSHLTCNLSKGNRLEEVRDGSKEVASCA